MPDDIRVQRVKGHTIICADLDKEDVGSCHAQAREELTPFFIDCFPGEHSANYSVHCSRERHVSRNERLDLMSELLDCCTRLPCDRVCGHTKLRQASDASI